MIFKYMISLLLITNSLASVVIRFNIDFGRAKDVKTKISKAFIYSNGMFTPIFDTDFDISDVVNEFNLEDGIIRFAVVSTSGSDLRGQFEIRNKDEVILLMTFHDKKITPLFPESSFSCDLSGNPNYGDLINIYCHRKTSSNN